MKEDIQKASLPPRNPTSSFTSLYNQHLINFVKKSTAADSRQEL